MQIRRATMEDMYQMQHCNLRCLPENYNLRYYLYHFLSWPQLLYVQEDHNRKVVGYVLAKIEDEEKSSECHGHITSIAVLRSQRRLGIASRLMRSSMKEMQGEYDANYCSLHVRMTNDAALHLYQDTLGFRCANVEEKYYVDDEDAYHMKKYFKGTNPGMYVTLNRQLIRNPITSNGAGRHTVGTGGTSSTAAAAATTDGVRHVDPVDLETLEKELLELEVDEKVGGKAAGKGRKQHQQPRQQQAQLKGGKGGKGKK